MTRNRTSLLLVTLLAATASLLGADLARGEDRTDPIPTTVGPPGGVGFYVNPNAPGLDPARVQEIIRRSLARWGDTFLGITANAPGAADGQNVIGIAPLDGGTLGLAQSRSTQAETPVAATQTCAVSARELNHKVTRRSKTVRLRRDRVVGKRARRRVVASVRRKLLLASYKRVQVPALAQLCTLGAATSTLTPTLEFDVTLRPAPQSGPWELGPALPTGEEFDFETNALHELGHVSGLAHQVDECDPSTPMPTTQAPTEFWHAPFAGQWLRPGCPAPAPPAPITGSDSGEPLPGPGATALAGQSILINPRVPAGYDPGRFVGVAERAIRRAGGTPAGLTEVAPTNGDGVTVLGFATLGVKVLSSSRSTPRQQILQAYQTKSCPKGRVRVLRQTVARRFVRVRGLRVRRDVIRSRRRTLSGYRCKTTTHPAQTIAVPPELDLRINDKSLAWEFGPRFPVDGTRWDLETAILQNLMAAGGVPAGTSCDPATPNTAAGASPGDWWRSTAEVRRSRCLSGGSNVEKKRTLRNGDGEGLVHRATGVPDDVQYLP